MRATTIRLEGKLLEEVEVAKPADRSLSAHVRRVLQKDLERRVRGASVAFRAFIDAHPDERAWLSEWDGTDLSAPPRAVRRRDSAGFPVLDRTCLGD